MSRINEIEKRMAEIKVELEVESADLDALESETNTLVEERKAEEMKIEKRKTLLDRVATMEVKEEDKIEAPFKEERVKMNVVEERANKLMKTGTMELSSTETRSVLLSTGTLAKPTKVGGINDPMNTISSILDLVTVEDLTGVGNYKEAYMKSYSTAAAGTDGSAPTPSDAVFRTVAINPFIIDTLSYVSKNLRKQTPLAYEEKVRQSALVALRRKVVSYLISGNGSTQPFGIYSAVNTESSPESMTQELLMSAATIDATTLRKIVFAYGGDENIGGGARLFLSKTDLIAFGDVRGTNEKKAVYDITPDGSNPNTGIIQDGGLSVPYVICSDVTPLSSSVKGVAKIPTMVYGAPGAYKLGLFGNYEVNVSEDYKFAEGLLSIKGDAMIGGNVVIDKGFVVVTLATA